MTLLSLIKTRSPLFAIDNLSIAFLYGLESQVQRDGNPLKRDKARMHWASGPWGGSGSDGDGSRAPVPDGYQKFMCIALMSAILPLPWQIRHCSTLVKAVPEGFTVLRAS